AGAANRVPVLIDGFISTAGALVAAGIAPAAKEYMLASHQSAEPGHRIMLEHLSLRPILNLDLRLGEGTGAALAMSIVEASVRVLREMATFDEAGVEEKIG
ncbi:MAG: nicotinate-nucleotide--dimethylbenzimidazole phosphoribosyltransferase, partial [Euryarchaeota archaeon]|nr:nicotinate-nucleotide--dimethylbenzimidazole phosphoribosyltransferase [Euryarchaeota archaeon]